MYLTCKKSEIGSPIAINMSTNKILRVKKFMREYPLRLSSNTDELIFVVYDSGTDSVGDPFLPFEKVPQFA